MTLSLIRGGLHNSSEGIAQGMRKPKHVADLPGISRGVNRIKKLRSISYQTLDDSRGPEVAECNSAMPKKDSKAPTRITPVTNLPSDSDNFGLPSDRDFVIYRLQRELTQLKFNERTLLGKLSYCAEVIVNEVQFFENGLRHDQWETLGELQLRRTRLKSCLDTILDPNAARVRLLTEEEKEKMRKQL